jgi:hypothetical protein
MEHTLGVGRRLLELPLVLMILKNLVSAHEGSEHEPKLFENLWLREKKREREK